MSHKAGMRSRMTLSYCFALISLGNVSYVVASEFCYDATMYSTQLEFFLYKN